MGQKRYDVQVFGPYTFAASKVLCCRNSRSGIVQQKRFGLEYGWDAPWRKPQYLNKKLKAASSNKSLYWSAAAVGDMEQALRNADLFDCAGIESKPFESAVFYDAKSNQTISLFYHLRNGFAHGRFCAFKSKGDIWFAIEDVAGKRKDDPAGDIKRLTARILIKNSTLCKWMKLIKAGPDIR